MVTRRQLLAWLSQHSQAGLALGATQPFGRQPANARSPAVPTESGHGQHVIVLGAGIAGLVAAYELERGGFRVTLVEARTRVGGKVWTLRQGDRVELIGKPAQTVRFSAGLHFDAGAARIANFHQRILGYARQFAVPLQTAVCSNRAAYLMPASGEKVRHRTVLNDLRGHLAELLAKSIRQGGLDTDIPARGKEKLLSLLRVFGDLAPGDVFSGSERSGFKSYAGAGDALSSHAPALPLEQLLDNELLPALVGLHEYPYLQNTMLVPVGGMDRIAEAFHCRLRSKPWLGTEVRDIRQWEAGVSVTCYERGGGGHRSLSGDYLFCTLPFNVLAGIGNDFPPQLQHAIGSVFHDEANKVAFESPRFWESEQIYGGSSYVGEPTTLIGYPSSGFNSERGILLACYNQGAQAEGFAGQTLETQLDIARAAVERLHPGHGRGLCGGIVIDWSQVPYSKGAWAYWGTGPRGQQERHIDGRAFRVLREPHGRIYFAGAALSQLPGWQEGAVLSAHAQLAALAARASAAPRSCAAVRRSDHGG